MSEGARMLYLEDSYCFDADAVVQGKELNPAGREMILLDQTIFYPQGGGQPFDQ